MNGCKFTIANRAEAVPLSQLTPGDTFIHKDALNGYGVDVFMLLENQMITPANLGCQVVHLPISCSPVANLNTGTVSLARNQNFVHKVKMDQDKLSFTLV